MEHYALDAEIFEYTQALFNGQTLKLEFNSSYKEHISWLIRQDEIVINNYPVIINFEGG